MAIDVRTDLESLGWEMIYECFSCGHRQEFANDAFPKYIVKLWPDKTPFFNIYLDNHAITSRFWGYQLRDKLKQYKLL